MRSVSVQHYPALIAEPERWTPERTACFMLINCMTREEWDRMIPDVIALGIDPERVPGIEAERRETLPTDQHWDERQQEAIRGACVPDFPLLRVYLDAHTSSP